MLYTHNLIQPITSLFLKVTFEVNEITKINKNNFEICFEKIK